MDRRIETRVVDTGGAALTTTLEKEPCELYWVTVNLESPGTQGVVKVYDGYNTDGKLEWQLEPAYSRNHNFVPCIHLDSALTIDNDANIASYTVGYRPKAWAGLR